MRLVRPRVHFVAMTNKGSSLYDLPRLGGASNYIHWARTIVNHLRFQNLDDYLRPSAESLTDPTDLRKSKQCAGILERSIEYHVLETIPSSIYDSDPLSDRQPRPDLIWSHLRTKYTSFSAQQRLGMMQTLVNFRCPEDEDARPHISKLISVHQQLVQGGERLSDQLLARVLLSSLPPSYEFEIRLLAATHQDSLTVGMVVSAAGDEWTRRTRQASPNTVNSNLVR